MESSRHALLPIYAIRLTFPHLAIGRFWRIVLKKSFFADD
jgi:hypothetical protein